MNGPSESEFASFKAQSDQAFAEMQRAADQAHAEFVSKYGGDMNPGAGFSAAPSAFSTASKSSYPGTPRAQAPSARSPANLDVPAKKLYETAPKLGRGVLSKDSLEDSVEDARKDLGKLSANLREESRAAAREAMRGTSDILKGKASGLGQKAKEEAARLKEAMQKAMEEERNLKAMRGRAAEEVRKARGRMQQHLEESKEDVMGDLSQMAKGQLDSLRGKATSAFEEGQDVMEREWKDFTSGQDS